MMTGLIFRTCAALFLAFVAVSHTATAATIEVISLQRSDGLHNGSIDVDSGVGNNLAPDGAVLCNFLLTGGIEKGDTERLQALIAQHKVDTHQFVPRLCLHSPGGLYDEGLKLATYLMENNIGTGVPATAECYSACAIIFMGGTAPWKGQINRFLHVKGTLGFHAPFKTGRNDNRRIEVEIRDLQLLFADGIKALTDFMRLGVGNEVRRITPELMQEMLAKGPSEFFFVDTVGKAIRFRIHIYGVESLPRLDDTGACNACVNMNYGAYERYGKGAETDLCKGLEPSRRQRLPKGIRMTNDVAPRGGSCSIDVALDKDGQMTAWTYVNDDRAEFGDGLELAYWFLYPPNTQLAALAGAGEKRPAGEPARRQPEREEAAPREPERREAPDPQRENDEFLRRLGEFVVVDYLGHGNPNHENRPEIFADRVTYFDKGVISRDDVMREKRAYYRRWPTRTFELIKDTLRLAKSDDGLLTVTFRYTFDVTDGRQRRRGIAHATLGVKEESGRLVIGREAGDVEKRF